MLKKDYLLEMIGSMCRAVSQIIFKRNRKEYAECHALADDEYQNLLGMPLSTLLSLPVETIFDFLCSFGQMDPQKVLILVDLLKEDAETFNTEGNQEMATAIEIKCIDLLNLLDHYELDQEDMEALDKRMEVFGIA